ncbi:MAG: NAD(P)H-dependent oxidoreductase [Parcubacteria group bacterium]
MFGLSRKKKKIFILLGHPDKDSFNCTLADEYEKGAEYNGHEVRRMNLSDMQFDPILRHGYRLIQELEPDLISFQENVKWCDHLIIFYPSWWSTMPALLKGLFDRAWMPGFAYKFTSDFTWKKLLKDKSATMVVTSDTIPLAQRIIFGDTTNELKRGILWFAGFGPIRVRKIGYLKHFGGTGRRERIKKKVFNFGKKAK